jgi:MFS family permease/HAMP domain-containing protein
MLWRNWVAFVAVLAVILGILGFLSILQHDAILARLFQERLFVIAETTGSSFRSVVNLGLPISTVRNGQEVLSQDKKIDPAVSSIRVFDPSGLVVYSTDPDNRDKISRGVLLLQSLSSGNRWNTESETELLAGFSIRNTVGDIVGGVLVSSSNRDFIARSDAMKRQIALMSAAILVVFSGLALLVLRVRLAGAIRGITKLQQLSQKFSVDQVPQSPALQNTATKPNYGFLSGEIVKLEQQLNEAFQSFHVAGKELAKLTQSGSDLMEPGTGGIETSGSSVASVPETSFARIFARHLTSWIVALILASAILLGYFIYENVAKSFEPELTARTKLIGSVANRDIQHAVSVGVPLAQLVGTENYFEGLLRNFPEVSYFGVATGRIVHESGARQKSVFGPERSRKDVPTFPIALNGEQIGYIIIDANPAYFALQFRDMLLDFGVVLLVVVLLAFQIITVVMSRSLTAPFIRLKHLAALQAAGDFSKVVQAKGEEAINKLSLRLSQHAADLHLAFEKATLQLSGQPAAAALEKLKSRFKIAGRRPDLLRFSYLNDVRLPLFMFAAADELPLAFFPIYARAAENPLTWLDPSVVISLPLAGYLAAIVFGSPLARPLAERFGHRKLLIFAVLPTLIAHLGLYFATSIIEIVVFRSITGLGYAIATLACQDYVLDMVPREHRNRSLGLFTAAMYSGIFAGTALGGVLADRLGQSSVFAISAGLVLLSGILTFRLLPAVQRESAAVTPDPIRLLPPIWQPLRSLRFAALVFGIAIPANILLQAFLSFLVALQLDALGASAADIGRILMVYFLAIALVGPAAPRLFEGRLKPAFVGLFGAIISALSLCAVIFWPAQWSMLIAVIGVGLGHGLIRDPQVSFAMEIAERELSHLGSNTVLGSLRTLERLGSIAGLISIALITSYTGYTISTALMAGMVFIGAIGFGVVVAGGRVNSRSRQNAESPPVGRD